VVLQLWGVKAKVLRGWFPERQWQSRVPLFVNFKLPYFVVVGRCDFNKGFDFAERVWREGGFEGSHELVFVHPHPVEQDRFGHGRGVRVFRNEVDYGGVISLLRGADAVLCPSTVEGMGLVPMEAACAGAKRVLLSDITVFKEYYQDCYPMRRLPLEIDAWADELRREPRGDFVMASEHIRNRYGYEAALARLECLKLVRRV
jgi:glycosyltransferase involved in cell wall biosynthesis